MTPVTLLNYAECGVMVALLMRLLIPGLRHMGLLNTAALGAVGACAGAWLDSAWNGPPVNLMSLSGDSWRGWVISIGGATFVISMIAAVRARRWWPYLSAGHFEAKRRTRLTAELRSMIYRGETDARTQQEEATVDRD